MAYRFISLPRGKAGAFGRKRTFWAGFYEDAAE
jgi:hypothetical protein